MRISQLSSSRRKIEKDVSRNPRHYHEESSKLLAEGKVDAALLASLQAVELVFSGSTLAANPWFVRHLMRLLVERDMPHLADMVYERATALGADRYLLSFQRARTLQALRRKVEALKVLEWAVKNPPIPESIDDHSKIEGYLQYLSGLK